MLPTLKYTTDLHDHVRNMRDGARFVLDAIGWSFGPAFAAWNALATATVDMHEVAGS